MAARSGLEAVAGEALEPFPATVVSEPRLEPRFADPIVSGIGNVNVTGGIERQSRRAD